MKIISIDLDREWAKQITHHMKICKNHTDIALIETRKRGFELTRAGECYYYSEILEKKCGCDEKQLKNQ